MQKIKNFILCKINKNNKLLKDMKIFSDSILKALYEFCKGKLYFMPKLFFLKLIFEYA